MKNESERIRSRPMSINQLARVFGLDKVARRHMKSARILARQIARSEHHIRARPLLNRGKAWR